MNINYRGFLTVLIFSIGSLFVPTISAGFSFKSEKSNSDNTLEQCQALLDKGLDLAGKQEIDSAILSFLALLELANEASIPEMQAKAHFQLGRNFEKNANYEKALEHLSLFLTFPNDIAEEKKHALALGYIARIYMALGEATESLRYRLLSLEKFESLKDTLGISRVNAEIGRLRYYQKNYKEALEYYEKAKAYAETTNNLRAIYSCVAGLGSVYEQLGNLEMALYHNNLSLELAKQRKYTKGVAYSLQNIGTNYSKMGDQTGAIELLQNSLDTFRQIKDLWGTSGSLNSLADVYAKIGNYPKALEYLEESLQITFQTKSKTRRADTYEALANTLALAGQDQKAVNFYQQFIALRDSILTEETLNMMSAQKSSYALSQQEKKIALLEKEKQITKLINGILIGAVAFGLLLTLIILSFNRSLKTANNKLENANIQLEEMNQQLETVNHQLEATNIQVQEQNKQLEEYNLELKNFTYAVSHDLKAPVRQVGSFSSLFLRRYKDQLDKNAKDYLHFITAAVNRMELLLKDLLNYATIGKHEEAVQNMEAKTVIDIAISNLTHSIEETAASISLPNKNLLPKIKGNQTQLIRLFQNIIGNALKYKSDQDPKIQIDIRPNGSKNIFSIKDNGLGIAPEYKEKIFEMFGRLHKWEEIEGSGIGLATCKKIVEKHGGEIWVESEVGKGSTFYFSLPKTNLVEVVS